MVTTTTSPRRTKELPLYQGVAPVPLTNPPPWIQTMTGRRASSSAGVCTLRVRQSSSMSSEDEPRSPPSRLPGCHEDGPKAVASRVPAHGSGGWGGRSRRGPVGGAA